MVGQGQGVTNSEITDGNIRFFIKPNLMQCYSSYVVTDLKDMYNRIPASWYNAAALLHPSNLLLFHCCYTSESICHIWL